MNCLESFRSKAEHESRFSNTRLFSISEYETADGTSDPIVYSNEKSISFLSSVIAFGPYMVFGNPFSFEKNYLNERLINSFCTSPGSGLFLPPETTKGQFEKYKKSYTNV